MAYVAETWWEGLSIDHSRPNQLTYSQPYRVYCATGEGTDPTDALIAAGLPQLGDGYAFDPSAVCVSRRWSPVKDTLDNFLCVCEFSNAVADVEENPLARPIKYSYRGAPFQRPRDRDRDGNAIVNSAGDRFLNIPPREDSRPVLTVSRNLASFSMATAIQYQDALNSDPIFGCDPGQLRMAEIVADEIIEGNYEYVAVTYQVQGRKEGWKLRLVDQGLYETGTGGKLKAITTDQGQDKGTPTFLDGNGAALAPGDDPVVLEFDDYDELPFSPLLT